VSVCILEIDQSLTLAKHSLYHTQSHGRDTCEPRSRSVKGTHNRNRDPERSRALVEDRGGASAAISEEEELP
jgi:hypothetical protein